MSKLWRLARDLFLLLASPLHALQIPGCRESNGYSSFPGRSHAKTDRLDGTAGIKVGPFQLPKRCNWLLDTQTKLSKK